jgi:prepilin-type N-terminal cleavage/methylation domain-containing protein
MFSVVRQRIPEASPLKQACRSAAFTLSEIVIALAILGAMASGVYIGFNSINAFAVSSRLYSEAQIAAQNQIDLALSKSPFDRDAAYISTAFDPCLNKIPLELMTTSEIDTLTTATTCGDGTSRTPVPFPTAAPTSTPATTSAYYPYYPYYRTAAGQPIQKQAFIYQDPTRQDPNQPGIALIVVTGTLTLNVTDTSSTMTFVGATKNLNTRKASVSVNYTFRSRDYTLTMDTLRTADQ